MEKGNSVSEDSGVPVVLSRRACVCVCESISKFGREKKPFSLLVLLLGRGKNKGRREDYWYNGLLEA